MRSAAAIAELTESGASCAHRQSQAKTLSTQVTCFRIHSDRGWDAAATARHATGDQPLRTLHRDSTGNPQRNRPYSQKKMHCPQVVLLPFLVEER